MNILLSFANQCILANVVISTSIHWIIDYLSDVLVYLYCDYPQFNYFVCKRDSKMTHSLRE